MKKVFVILLLVCLALTLFCGCESNSKNTIYDETTTIKTSYGDKIKVRCKAEESNPNFIKAKIYIYVNGWFIESFETSKNKDETFLGKEGIMWNENKFEKGSKAHILYFFDWGRIESHNGGITFKVVQ